MSEAMKLVPRRMVIALAASACLAAEPGAAQPNGAPPPASEAGATAALAGDLEREAAQAETVAEQILAAPPSETAEVLRQAELNGVGSAWFARRRIFPQTIGASQARPTSAERAAAVRWLREQSSALGRFVDGLEGIIARRDLGPAELGAELDRLQVPEAALIVLGSPAAPDPRGGPQTMMVTLPSATMLVAGHGASLTNDYPAVGAVYTNPSDPRVSCTGTLISPRTVVTAAHCLRPPYGRIPVAVFFQHAGRLAVVDHAVHPGYGPAAGSDQPMDDIAVLQLERPVTAIRPVSLMQPGMLGAGVQGTIVGFGFRNSLTAAGAPVAGPDLVERTGIKLAGTVETRVCQGIAGLAISLGRICWEYKGSHSRSATVCSGDSGGPLFVEASGTWRLAGVTSFALAPSGTNPCTTSSAAVDTDVSSYHAWLLEQVARFDTGAPDWMPAALQPVLNHDQRFSLARFERLGGAPATASVVVKSESQFLSVAVNGTDRDQRAELSLINPQGEVVCRSGDLPPLVHCAQIRPAAGEWRIQVHGAVEQELQLTAVQF